MPAMNHLSRLLSHGPRVAAARVAVVGLIVLPLLGCENRKVVEQTPPGTPAATFTGESYLRGTIGSLAELRNFEPQLVSGFGVVVGLDGTGSAEIPSAIRLPLINEAGKRGVGSRIKGFSELTPEQFLQHPDTAVVRVQGLLPPGATKGSTFDLVVEAMPQTQTTSLAGGRLWTTELAIGGANEFNAFSRPMAEGAGPIYLDPFDDRTPDELKRSFMRQGIVVGGGRATTDRTVRLLLNEPSWLRSRAVADRINQRFPPAPGQKPIATAKSDLVIDLHIPERFKRQPSQLLRLIARLYLRGGEGFEEAQAQRLIAAMRANPGAAEDITYALKGLGKLALPVLRSHYEDGTLVVRQSCLDAGAWLADHEAAKALAALAESPDAGVRRAVAQSLSHLRRNMVAARALNQLLDDADITVRVTAYESLAHHADPGGIRRLGIYGAMGLKFIIDRVVTSHKPLIYVTHEDAPRLVLFGSPMWLNDVGLVRMWDNRLMFRSRGREAAAEVYYQPPQGPARKFQVEPTLEAMAYLLGHFPTKDLPQEGLDLTYGEVVDALVRLAEAGAVKAQVEIAPSQLMLAIRERERDAAPRVRPTLEDGLPTTSPAPAPGDEPIGRAPATAPARADVEATRVAREQNWLLDESRV